MTFLRNALNSAVNKLPAAWFQLVASAVEARQTQDFESTITATLQAVENPLIEDIIRARATNAGKAVELESLALALLPLPFIFENEQRRKAILQLPAFSAFTERMASTHSVRLELRLLEHFDAGGGSVYTYLCAWLPEVEKQAAAANYAKFCKMFEDKINLPAFVPAHNE